MPVPFIFDMETNDPDDMFALCFLASHPNIDLKAVTVTPGSKAQLGIVRHLLHRLNLSNIAVGARNPDTEKDAVSEFHYCFLGKISPQNPDDLAHNILAETLRSHPDATILTGAPLQNLRLLLTNHPDITIQRWVGQGGFAGDSVVLSQFRLPKFTGRETCPSFNFNGDPKGVFALLTSDRVFTRDLVAKNVCHGVAYDRALHDRVKNVRDRSAGLNLMYEGMDLYLKKHPQGKLFHDPLAACIAVDRDIATFREVEIYREKGEWGSRLAENTNTFIAIAIDLERFFQTLMAYRPS